MVKQGRGAAGWLRVRLGVGGWVGYTTLYCHHLETGRGVNHRMNVSLTAEGKLTIRPSDHRLQLLKRCRECWWWCRASYPRMSVDILKTNCDQCRSMVQCCLTSTETVRLIRKESPGRPPRLSYSSWTLLEDVPLVELVYLVFTRMPDDSYRKPLRFRCCVRMTSFWC